MPLRKLEQRYIVDQILDQGFDEAMCDKEDLFSDVEDQEFHARLRSYLEAREELVKYVGVKL
jgi:hypothetical protein